MTNLALFASGSGSNYEAIQRYVTEGKIAANIRLVVTDRVDAFVIQRAKKYDIPVLALSPKAFETKEAYEQAILAELKKYDIDWLILAGYMRLIGPVLLGAYADHIVNIHPSLLPSFPGKDAIGQALAHGVKVTGVTVHYVDEGMDTGRIIQQRAVEVVEGDREQTEAAIHAMEHILYPEVLQNLFNS
ncbi:phosphoribosylglycinamide formyltransferase [Kurthia senegalensis]|uniref:phosphoribosylglycinamide formyltransferase n=1 Tax=Kurthia senegalensis TaxID=1033740 RepID=UPI000289CC2F|nr:phosphoribosylglycinamide formyltransferase [Kurthia senegalensis]